MRNMCVDSVAQHEEHHLQQSISERIKLSRPGTLFGDQRETLPYAIQRLDPNLWALAARPLESVHLRRALTISILILSIA